MCMGKPSDVHGEKFPHCPIVHRWTKIAMPAHSCTLHSFVHWLQRCASMAVSLGLGTTGAALRHRRHDLR